jgi:hypothetical protein
VWYFFVVHLASLLNVYDLMFAEGRKKIARHLSWSNHDCRSQIGGVKDHHDERADEGNLQG